MSGLRREVRSSPGHNQAPAERPPPKGRRHTHHKEEEDRAFSALLGYMFAPVLYAGGAVVTSPFWGPWVLAGEDNRTSAQFALYPYQHGSGGHMTFEPDAADRYPWSLRLRGEYSDDLDSLQRFSGHVLWESQYRIGVDGSADFRRERLAPGEHDNLWMGDTNVVWRFAQCRDFEMRTGLGVNWLADHVGGEAGFNFTYGGDWYVRDPWIVSGEIDWGRLGHSELFHGRATIGWQHRGVELFTGYDHLNVGGVEWGGVVSGLRIWF